MQKLPRDIRAVECQSLDAVSTYSGIRDKARDLLMKCFSLEETGSSPMGVGAVGDGYATVGEDFLGGGTSGFPWKKREH